jgi:C4-dicarboxylate transporter DctQ subunit
MFMRRVDTLVTSVNEWLLVLIGTTFTALILLQVVARYVFQFSIFRINALSEFMLVWFVFLGVGLGFRYGMHATMDLVENLIPSRLKRSLNVLQIGIALLFFVFLIVASFYAVPASMRNVNPSIGVSFAWGVAAVPIGSLFALWHLAVMLRDKVSGAPLSELEPLADFGASQRS